MSKNITEQTLASYGRMAIRGRFPPDASQHRLIASVLKSNDYSRPEAAIEVKLVECPLWET